MVYEVDTVFDWQSEKDPAHNQCRIRIYWITWEKAIIVATDISENSADSKIAKCTKEIISFASNLYDLFPNKTMLIEHYPKQDLSDEDIYLQVLLTKDKTVRYEIEREDLIRLINKQI